MLTSHAVTCSCPQCQCRAFDAPGPSFMESAYRGPVAVDAAFAAARETVAKLEAQRDEQDAILALLDARAALPARYQQAEVTIFDGADGAVIRIVAQWAAQHGRLLDIRDYSSAECGDYTVTRVTGAGVVVHSRPRKRVARHDRDEDGMWRPSDRSAL